MLIELLYFDDCPNWAEADRQIRDLVQEGFAGSPTFGQLRAAIAGCSAGGQASK